MAYLDDIIAGINGDKAEEKPAGNENNTQNAPVEAKPQTSRLRYSDEFYARFSKSATATKENG